MARDIPDKDVIHQIEKRICLVENDDRFQAEPVAVQINAPLALTQVALKARLQALQEIHALLKEGGW